LSAPFPIRRAWAGRMLYAWQAVILFLGLLGLVAWQPMIGRPFPGIVYIHQRERDSYMVYFETGAHFPGILAGLRINDRLLAINGQAPSYQAIDQVVRQVAALPPERQVLVYDVERQGQRLSISVPLAVFTLSLLLEAKLPLIILGLCYLVLALLVYRARPGEPVNQVFAVFSTLVASICLSIGYGGVVGQPLFSSRLPGIILWEAGVPFLCAVVWHYIAVFPDRDESSWLFRLRRVWYVPAGFAALVNIYQGAGARYPLSPGLSLGVSLGTLAWLGAVLLLAAVHLARASRRSPLQRVRRQARAMLIGGGLGIVPPLIPLFAFFLNQNLSVLFGNNLYYLGLLFPLAVAYAILRYNLFRSKSTILALLILVGFSVLAANALYYLLNYLLDWPVAFLPLLLSSLVTGLAWEVRSPLRRLFDRLFLRAAHDYQALSRFSEGLLSVPQQMSAFADVCRIIAGQLGLTEVALWVLNQGGASLQQAASYGSHPAASVRVTEPLRVELSRAAPGPIRVQDRGSLIWAQVPSAQRAAAFVPLVDGASFLGLLLVGPRWNDEPLDDEDLALLGLMGRQIGLALLAMQQTAELRQVPHRIAEAQEQERYEIARDLHDTVQQFLAGLPLFLETARRSLRHSPEKASRLLEECEERSSRASWELRAIRHHLSPEPLGGQDLTGALRTLVELSRAVHSPEIGLRVQGDVETGLTAEIKMALYRVVQQALENALVHAGGRQVEVILQQADRRILFAVVDDGRGFDAARPMLARQEGHDGLWIMQDRIALVGGELTIESSPGHGTEVRGWVPVSGAAGQPVLGHAELP
jgi:signal transduction histidine kinase